MSRSWVKEQIRRTKAELKAVRECETDQDKACTIAFLVGKVAAYQKVAMKLKREEDAHAS